MLKNKVKNLYVFSIMLLFTLCLAGNAQAQEAKQPTQTEKTEPVYQKGDLYKGKQGEIMELISQRSFGQGIIAWKTKSTLNGKKSTIYVPTTYLAECEKIDNQK